MDEQYQTKQFHEAIDSVITQHIGHRLRQARARAFEEAAEMVRMRMAMAKSAIARDELRGAAGYLAKFAEEMKHPT